MNDAKTNVLMTLKNHRGQLTRQQIKTLRGQVLAGDADGAMRGLERILLGEAGE